tara:strand:- start:415 stop:726 length:312 start_codon:yes stop_codon:yes gene_type:complete
MSNPSLTTEPTPAHIELHTSGCIWHRDRHNCDCGTFEDMSARSSVEEQGPSKPKVVGSSPTERDLQIAQLELAKEVTSSLIRDCSEATQLAILEAFSEEIDKV